MRAKAIGAVGLVAALAATLCLLLGSTASADQATGTPQPVFQGAYSSFPDYMDPQLSYTSEGWTAMYDVYIPLLTYRHAEGLAGSEVIPGLATALPKITHGGKKYTLFLRPGLRYSDGAPVHASDFRHAIERLFAMNSGGTIFYSDIVGARDYAKRRSAHITGIVTNDKTGKIVIHLVKPRGTFSNELALPFAAPVPSSTPMEDQSFSPPPATGPYAITESNFRGWSYERNPQWATNGAAMPQIPGGQVERIHISVIWSSQKQVDELKSGKLDWLFDPPSLGQIAEVKAGAGGAQIRIEPTASTYYFWMNTRKAPFNSLKVRQAVNYAVDPAVLRHIYGGQLSPTDQILPPGMPGYRRFDLYPHDMAKARNLIREADPKNRNITVWTDEEGANLEAGIYYSRVLEKLGFQVRFTALGADNYFTVIGNTRQTKNLDTGFADWFEDYPHPNDFFQPLLAAKPTAFNNENFAQMVDPKLSAKVAALDERDGPVDEAAYARLDREFMTQAPIVPFGTRTLAASFSSKVDLEGFIWNPTFESDFTSFRFK